MFFRSKVKSIIFHGRRSWSSYRVAVLFLAALGLAAVLHGYNAFYYPYFESDEGTYLLQAYAVKEQGELGLYTYWYDHPPFGWLTVATWITLLPGDWSTFGSPLNTGRVFMLVLHLLQVSIIFFIVNRLTRSPWWALLAIGLYSVSPMAVYFQRRVLLDNMMTTWVLLSIVLLFLRQVKLRHVVLSGLCFGLALLTKYSSVLFAPAIVYLLFISEWKIPRGFRFFAWLVSAFSLFSLWFLYAAIKSELIPSPDGDRVSLFGAVLYQASRGTGMPFWQGDSPFMRSVESWMVLDTTYVYLLGAGLVMAIFLSIFSARYRVFGLAGLLYLLFIIRGGEVLGFYYLPMLPFLVFSIVFSLETLQKYLRRRHQLAGSAFVVLLVTVVGGLVFHYQPKVAKYLTVDETTNQIESLRWVKRELPEDSKIIVDVLGMTELLDPHFENAKSMKNADWYFKVALDPSIRYEKHRNDYRNFDYILISHEMLFQSSLHKLPLVYDAIRYSEPVRRWDKNSSSFIDIQNFLSTNGDWMALYKINNNTRTQLQYAWNYYRDNFVVSYGQVVDPQTEVTTSEGQSYALLRAVLMNDRDAFNGIWQWTQHHLQHRLDDELISWRWQDGKQTDSVNATDADLDIALALIFASQRFAEPAYMADAKAILADIWRQCVVTVNGRYYLLPMEKQIARRDNYYLLNPSYFSPAHYRIFAEVDEERKEEWLQLADDTYAILGDTLPADWVMINDTSGETANADIYTGRTGTGFFGYDAFRTLWRVALDAEWHDTPAAVSYLKSVSPVFIEEWSQRQSFSDQYTRSGQRVRNNYSPAVAAGILSGLRFGASAKLSADVYNQLFVKALVIDGEQERAHWSNSDNYYDSNWNWLGVALYTGNLPNLWVTSKPK